MGPSAFVSVPDNWEIYGKSLAPPRAYPQCIVALAGRVALDLLTAAVGPQASASRDRIGKLP
jgi:hypothetical protein